MEDMKRTNEVLRDKDLMSQIKEGQRKDVKLLDFEEVAKELGIDTLVKQYRCMDCSKPCYAVVIDGNGVPVYCLYKPLDGKSCLANWSTF